MIVTNLISSKVCVEQFYSNTGLQAELNDDDFRLWTAEIVDIIGFPLQYIPKVIGVNSNPEYHFENYQVPLPCDFHKLIPGGISVDGNYVRWNQNSFHYLMDGDCCDVTTLNDQKLQIFTDQFGNQFAPELGRQVNDQFQEVTFSINDGTITFNKKTGDCCLAYWAIPIDNEGYVMIPDTAKYKRAVTNYIIWKNDYILWRQQSLSDKVFKHSDDEMNWAIASCIGELKMPSVEQVETIKNSIIRLTPLVTAYNQFFRKLGQQERKRY